MRFMSLPSKSLQCAYNTQPLRQAIGNSKGEGASKAKKESMKPNWKFQGVGVQTKNLSWGRYRYFLKPHIAGADIQIHWLWPVKLKTMVKPIKCWFHLTSGAQFYCERHPRFDPKKNMLQQFYRLVCSIVVYFYKSCSTVNPLIRGFTVFWQDCRASQNTNDK